MIAAQIAHSMATADPRTYQASHRYQRRIHEVALLSHANAWRNRNRPDAGRLSIRKVGGKPQPRWHEGVKLAKELDATRDVS